MDTDAGTVNAVSQGAANAKTHRLAMHAERGREDMTPATVPQSRNLHLWRAWSRRYASRPIIHRPFTSEQLDAMSLALNGRHHGEIR